MARRFSTQMSYNDLLEDIILQSSPTTKIWGQIFRPQKTNSNIKIGGHPKAARRLLQPQDRATWIKVSGHQEEVALFDGACSQEVTRTISRRLRTKIPRPIALGEAWHLRGINIQRRWAQLILARTKTVEARKYPLKGYENEYLWLVQTTGHAEETSIVGVVRFKGCVEYLDLVAWRADRQRHCVPHGDVMDWSGPEQPGVPRMFGWNVAAVHALKEPQPGPDTKGMIGCKAVTRSWR